MLGGHFHFCWLPYIVGCPVVPTPRHAPWQFSMPPQRWRCFACKVVQSSPITKSLIYVSRHHISHSQPNSTNISTIWHNISQPPKGGSPQRAFLHLDLSIRPEQHELMDSPRPNRGQAAKAPAPGCAGSTTARGTQRHGLSHWLGVGGWGW